MQKEFSTKMYIQKKSKILFQQTDKKDRNEKKDVKKQGVNENKNDKLFLTNFNDK